MGEAGFRAVIVVVLVSFIPGLLSLQAAPSRLDFSPYARDPDEFSASKYLSRMSPGHHVPATALIVMGRDTSGDRRSRHLWLQDAIHHSSSASPRSEIYIFLQNESWLGRV